MPDFRRDAVTVRVPATSANLGPGFDSFGLALTLYDELRAQVTDEGLSVTVLGEGAASVPTDERNLAVRSMRAAFAALGGQPAGMSLRFHNVIAHGRGLGSSAAAIVAGILAARELSVRGSELLDDDATLGLAAQMEGHADNVAACMFGGLTISWADGLQPRCVTLRPHPDVVPVLFVPPERLSTQRARELLPAHVPHADAAANAARAALLVLALTRSPDHLLAATDDRLHQEYRSSAMPETLALIRRLRAGGVAAVVSGAGPSVVALTRSLEAVEVSAEAPAGWRSAVVGVDVVGATCR